MLSTNVDFSNTVFVKNGSFWQQRKSERYFERYIRKRYSQFSNIYQSALLYMRRLCKTNNSYHVSDYRHIRFGT